VSHLAYAVEAADIRTVIVDGRIVLRDGMLTTADEREIRRQVRALAMRIGSFRGGTSS
jgi:cytosine/adenosine deaminase-related metal-dependent hydrolase